MSDHILFKLNRDEAAIVYASLAMFSQLQIVNKKDASFFSLTDALATVKDQCEAQGLDAQAHCERRMAEDMARSASK